MLSTRMSEIAGFTGGSLHGSDVAVSGVGIDSRKLAAGDLFVALPGAHSDGHDHLADARARGAAAALVARHVDVDLPQLEVADPAQALAAWAAGVRRKSDATVVGITGSNGKTTVKTMLAAILRCHGPTHVSAGNFNNELGLPLSVLAMPRDTRYAVFEMGAGKPGDIAELAAIARPDVGLVNNIGPAHLERMGDEQQVATIKRALYAALPGNGTAIINADDAFAGFMAKAAGHCRIMRFGFGDDVDVGLDNLRAGPDGSRFQLRAAGTGIDVVLPLPGRHNVANALAATAIALALEVPLETIATGLADVEAVPGRQEMHVMPGGWRLIDDSYNANPASLAAAIDVLLQLPGTAWLVLGDMAELGAAAGRAHARCGEMARERGVERLWTTGALSRQASEAFGTGARHFATIAELAEAVLAELHAGVNCLVKGSRSAATERVVALLRADSQWGDRHAA